MAITASRLVEAVRAVVQDRGKTTWSDNEILDAAHEEFGSIWQTIKLAGRDHELDFLDLAASEFTKLPGNDHIWEYQLPEWVGAVRLVKQNPGTGYIDGQVIDRMELHDAETANRLRLGWTFTEGAYPGKFAIWGRMASPPASIRVWFIRRFVPPPHWGPCSGAGTTTRVLFPTAGNLVGRIVPRDDVYVGYWIEITEDSLAASANIGQRRKVVGSDLQGLDLEQALPFATSTDTTYEIVFPIALESVSFLVWSVASELVGRAWNDREAIMAIERRTQTLEERFMSDLRARVPQEPIVLSRNITY